MMSRGQYAPQNIWLTRGEDVLGESGAERELERRPVQMHKSSRTPPNLGRHALSGVRKS